MRPLPDGSSPYSLMPAPHAEIKWADFFLDFSRNVNGHVNGEVKSSNAPQARYDVSNILTYRFVPLAEGGKVDADYLTLMHVGKSHQLNAQSNAETGTKTITSDAHVSFGLTETRRACKNPKLQHVVSGPSELPVYT